MKYKTFSHLFSCLIKKIGKKYLRRERCHKWQWNGRRNKTIRTSKDIVFVVWRKTLQNNAIFSPSDFSTPIQSFFFPPLPFFSLSLRAPNNDMESFLFRHILVSVIVRSFSLSHPTVSLPMPSTRSLFPIVHTNFSYQTYGDVCGEC